MVKVVELGQRKGLTHRVNAVVPRPMKIKGSHGSPVTAAIIASAAQNTQGYAPEGSPTRAWTAAPDTQSRPIKTSSMLTSHTA